MNQPWWTDNESTLTMHCFGFVNATGTSWPPSGFLFGLRGAPCLRRGHKPNQTNLYCDYPVPRMKMLNKFLNSVNCSTLFNSSI